MLLVLGLAISGGTAGVIAGGGGSSGKSSAGKSQYVKPGKGCGDKNHVHERRGECKDKDKKDKKDKKDDDKDKGGKGKKK